MANGYEAYPVTMRFIQQSNYDLRNRYALLNRTVQELARACAWIKERHDDLQYGSVLAPEGRVRKVSLPEGSEGMVLKTFQTRGEVGRIGQAMKEIQMMNMLSHPHIVKQIECLSSGTPGQYDYVLYSLMAPAAESTLAEFLAQAVRTRNSEKSRVNTLRLRLWLHCLASALNYMHSIPIFHEDIKPSNIVCSGNDIFFVDFGSARHPSSDGTVTGSPALATNRYAAPEAMQYEDGVVYPHGSQTDIFSLGLVFLEMLWAIQANRNVVLYEYLLHWHRTTEDLPYYRLMKYFDHIDLDVHSKIIYNNVVKPMLAWNRGNRPRTGQVLERVRHFESVLKCLCS
jgi:serine/threonine protein kinase